MNTNLLIEIVGYIGSFLVLVSFLMTSVFKLRVVNTVGSLIFMIYALIIHSYPTAIMNFCLVLINLHFLWKMSHDEKQYALVEVDVKDSYLKHILSHYKEDIKTCFPGIDDSFAGANRCFIVSNEGNPVGITLGKENNGEMELFLDYSIPAFRDFSIGSYLMPQLAANGIHKLTYNGPTTQSHIEYLNRMGFTKNNNSYEKNL
ncbi:MAG: YgjV family protein [Solobacterium sp.]|nr:YgjV family protein [Solobacterium sp.]